MDIISEILETDRLAEEKIKKAYEQKAQLEQQTDEQIQQLKKDAVEKTKSIREKLSLRTKAEIQEQTEKAEKEEKERIARLDELYSTKHRKWEKAICEKIISNY
ncbi:MAG: hypothetical protein J5956_04870 [Ruminococcus sp.]|nr:hypothetical protein [Ruminococcus sp.]